MFWVDLIITHHLKPVQKLYFHLIFIVILVKKFLSVSSARAGNVMGGGDMKKIELFLIL